MDKRSLILAWGLVLAPALLWAQGPGTRASDYFPARAGDQWTYRYLKPDKGQAAPSTFTVRCTESKALPGGKRRVVFQSDEGGGAVRFRYVLSGRQVEHTATLDRGFKGDFVFKLPKRKGARSPSWSVREKNGTLHRSFAVYGKARVYGKLYPDCVIVTEKVSRGGRTRNTVLYYYARGAGLVSMEVYSRGMRLLEPDSTILVDR